MNGYIAYFESKTAEVYAETSYSAQLKAIEHFRPAKSKRHLVTVVLATKNGEQITHVADF